MHLLIKEHWFQLELTFQSFKVYTGAMTTHDRRTDGFLLGFFTALIGSSSIPTEKCEVCTCAIYHSPQIIEAEGPLGVDIYNFIKAAASSESWE